MKILLHRLMLSIGLITMKVPVITNVNSVPRLNHLPIKSDMFSVVASVCIFIKMCLKGCIMFIFVQYLLISLVDQ